MIMGSLGLLLFSSLASAGTVSMKFNRAEVPVGSEGAWKRGTASLTAKNQQVAYWADLQIGTPAQDVSLLIDTGSHDIWVTSVESPACDGDKDASSQCGFAFDPEMSDTFEVVDEGGFSIAYLNATNGAEGDWIKDVVWVDGNEIPDQQMGLAKSLTPNTGVMGLGFAEGGVADETYPVIVENMVSAGVIDRAAFSIFFDEADAASGSILFGGIDTDKFTGDFKYAPLMNEVDGVQYSKMWSVGLSGVSITTSDSDAQSVMEDMNYLATLDSGAPGTAVPQALLEAISENFEIEIKTVTLDGGDLALIPCKYAGEDGEGQSITFTFGDDMTVEVPLALLVDDLKDETTMYLHSNLIDPEDPPFDIEETCLLGVQSTSLYAEFPPSFALFGRNILRNAYLVFDMEDEQIGMAKAVFGSSESTIVELKTGEDLSGGGGSDEDDSSGGDGGNDGGDGSDDDDSTEDESNDDEEGAARKGTVEISSLLMALGVFMIGF